MTETNLKNNDTSIKKNRSHRLNLILAMIVSFVCCLSTPLTSIEHIGNILGIITVVLCSVFAVRFSSRKIATVILLVTTFTLFGLANGLAVIVFVLAATVGCGALAWLISKTESPFLAIIPAVAYAISTVLTKDWFASLLTLIFILPAIILAQSYEKASTRVSAIARVSVGYIVFIALGIVLSVLYFTGEFRFEIVAETLEGIKLSLVKVISSLEMTMINGETQMFMSETEAYNYMSLLFSILPALTVILCFVLAYFAQKVQFSVFSYTEEEIGPDDTRRIFTMSPVASVVFLLSFTVYFFTSMISSAATVATVAANLYLILLPGLSYMGIKAFLGRKPDPERRGCSSVIVTVMFFVLLAFSPSTALIIAACFGAFKALEDPIKKLISKKDDQ